MSNTEYLEKLEKINKLYYINIELFNKKDKKRSEYCWKMVKK